MNMNNSAKLVGGFPNRPETLVTERDSVDVAENHGAAKLKLLHGAAQFSDAGCGIAERKRGQGDVEAAIVRDGAGKSVIGDLREFDCRGRLLNVRARRGERDDLSVDFGFAQDLGPIGDVAVAAHGNVVVARVVQLRIALGVVVNADGAWSLLNGLHVLRRIVMIMEVDRWHAKLAFRSKEQNLTTDKHG